MKSYLYFDAEKKEYDYAHEAVLDGVVLEADQASIPSPVKGIIDRMLLNDPEKRISASEAYHQLTVYYNNKYAAYSYNTASDLGRNGSGSDIDSSKRKNPNDYFRPAGKL